MQFMKIRRSEIFIDIFEFNALEIRIAWIEEKQTNQFAHWCWITSGQHLVHDLTRVAHICVSKLTNIGSDNGLPPGWHQAIIQNNAGI